MMTTIRVRLIARLALLVTAGVIGTAPSVSGQTPSSAPAATAAPAPPRPAAVTPPTPAGASGPVARPRPRPRPAPRPGEVAEEPIRCWWKTDRTAVSVGERFAVVLTCATLETGPTTVVPNVSQLEGGAIQLTPFEVVSSARRADVVAPPRRYIQFEYVARMLSDGFFGQDVALPALTVTYNFKTADGANMGRDQNYVLPALSMRVLSLVPRAAGDIRDTSAMTFGDIERARFRATVARVVSWVAVAFTAVLAALAVLRASRRFRRTAPGTVRKVSEWRQLGACASALRAVRKDAAGGWSAELARRALPALRVAGAAGLGRPVSQQKVDRDVAQREGQLVVTKGLLRRERTMLSASTTPVAIAASAEQKGLSGRQRGALGALGRAIEALNAVGYARPDAEVDGTALNAALEQGLDAVRRLRVGTLWPMRAMSAVARTFSAW